MEKRKEYIRRAASLLFCFFLAAVMVFGCIFGVQRGKIEVSAAEIATGENAFDGTSVNEDLKDMDLSGYTFNAMLDPQVIYFMEYCYAEDVIDCVNYGLYIYVYNPAKLTFSDRIGANTLNMAVEYNAEGKPSGYANVRLKVCGQSTDTLEGLIWKFRVVDEGNKILSNARALEKQTGERRYDISDVKLYKSGAADAESFEFGRTYFFKGYAKGYGTAEESTLSGRYEYLEVFSVEPEFTNYRMPSEYKENIVYEVNTAYFSVPDKYISQYGRLQKIHAEWDEYKTEPIFVTEDEAAYEALKDYVGVYIGEYDMDLRWDVWSNDYVYYIPPYATSPVEIPVEIGYNNTKAEDLLPAKVNYRIPQISWLFSTEGESWDGYHVSKERVKLWADAYCSAYGKEADILDKYSDDLFTDSIDAARVQFLEDPESKRGHVELNLDADEDKNLLLSYDDTHSGWQKFWDYFFNWGDTSSGTNSNREYTPIYEITKADLLKDKAEFCDDLLVSEDDYDGIVSWASAEIDKGEHPYLFRFAQTDYYSQEMHYNSRDVVGFSAVDGFISQETVFLNFNMIDMTFRKGETDTVIPVAMDPVDVFNGVDGPIVEGWRFPEGWDEWWSMLLTAIATIGGILLIVALWGPITTLLGLLWKAVCLPFKAISNAVKERKNRKK